MREVRTADSDSTRSGGRRPARLPVIPLLLTAVRTTAVNWEADGQGDDLDPDLRLWLHSDKAARYTGPPLQRPLALRGLRDLQEADAELLWLAEVEALPLPVVARRLGLDPALLGEELDQVRGLFRDRCRRAHLDTPMAAQCRSYARLLDAITRSPAADIPADLSRHLAMCVDCAESAACLRAHGGGLPAEPERGESWLGSNRARVVRNGLLISAVLVSLLALAVSMSPGPPRSPPCVSLPGPPDGVLPFCPVGDEPGSAVTRVWTRALPGRRHMIAGGAPRRVGPNSAGEFGAGEFSALPAAAGPGPGWR